MKDTSPQVYRPSTKGKLFSRNERVSIVLGQRATSARQAMRSETIAIARKALDREKMDREIASKARKALLANPTVKKIIFKKDGSAYFQGRIAGKIQPAVLVHAA